jgi:hypothetical protein
VTGFANHVTSFVNAPITYLEVVSGLAAVGGEGDGGGLVLEGGQLLCEVVVVQGHEVREKGVREEVFATSELQLTSGHLDEVVEKVSEIKC